MISLRGLTTENARKVRQQGHDDAFEFAQLIDVSQTYLNDLKAKKDVVDKSGDAHSVKSGKKKWQIFLYGYNRFISDESFQSMNGIGQLLAECINVFPVSFNDYLIDKNKYKINLKQPMMALKDKLQNKNRVKSFFSKAMFNFGEVKYLTVKDDNVFHVFLNNDVNDVFANYLIVENSKKQSKVSFDAQKVIFKYKDLNLAELEMRNDSYLHYREIRFNMLKPRAMALLFEKIKLEQKYKENIFVYGNAHKTFGRWSDSS